MLLGPWGGGSLFASLIKTSFSNYFGALSAIFQALKKTMSFLFITKMAGQIIDQW